MYSPDAIVAEDWDGLESETERLLIVYGYPTQGQSDLLFPEEAVDKTVEEKETAAIHKHSSLVP